MKPFIWISLLLAVAMSSSQAAPAANAPGCFDIVAAGPNVDLQEMFRINHCTGESWVLLKNPSSPKTFILQWFPIAVTQNPASIGH